MRMEGRGLFRGTKQVDLQQTREKKKVSIREYLHDLSGLLDDYVPNHSRTMIHERVDQGTSRSDSQKVGPGGSSLL